MPFFDCFKILTSKKRQTSSSESANLERLKHEDLVSLLVFGSLGQKVLAAQRITNMAAGSDTKSQESRRILLCLDALSPLIDMTQHPKVVCRAAAAQAICNLALEAVSATHAAAAASHAAAAALGYANGEGGTPSPHPSSPFPAWKMLERQLPSIVPTLINLLCADFPEGPHVACQTLANLARGPRLLEPLLRLLRSLPVVVQHVVSSVDPNIKQLFAQFMLNAALHSGAARHLDHYGATQALIYLLEDSKAPSQAHERSLCTLYNMLREDAPVSRALDLLSQPAAVPALCTHLLRQVANCRFLSACLIMCMLHLPDEEAEEPEEQLRHQRRVATLLCTPQLMDAVQHALASSVNTVTAQGFTYGRYEQLLQALVSALNSMCAAVPVPVSPVPTTQQPASSCRPRCPLELVTSATVGVLLQLLGSGSTGGGAVAAAGTSTGSAAQREATASLVEACLRQVSLMSSHASSCVLLVHAPEPGIYTRLMALLRQPAATEPVPPEVPQFIVPTASPVAALALQHKRSPSGTSSVPEGQRNPSFTSAAGGPGPESAAAAGLPPLPPSATTTPRIHARMYHMRPPSHSGAGLTSSIVAGLGWWACRALAATVLRNLAVMEPASLLAQPNIISGLLEVISSRIEVVGGPSDSAVVDSQSVADGDAGQGGREEGNADEALEDWKVVQRQAVAALIALTSKQQAATGCAAVLDAGGAPIIMQAMERGLAAGGTHGTQMAAWCAALLCQLYIGAPGARQKAVTEVLMGWTGHGSATGASGSLSNGSTPSGATAAGGLQPAPWSMTPRKNRRLMLLQRALGSGLRLQRRSGAAARPYESVTLGPTGPLTASLMQKRVPAPAVAGAPQGPNPNTVGIEAGADAPSEDVGVLSKAVEQQGAAAVLSVVHEGAPTAAHVGKGKGFAGVAASEPDAGLAAEVSLARLPSSSSGSGSSHGGAAGGPADEGVEGAGSADDEEQAMRRLEQLVLLCAPGFLEAHAPAGRPGAGLPATCHAIPVLI